MTPSEFKSENSTQRRLDNFHHEVQVVMADWRRKKKMVIVHLTELHQEALAGQRPPADIRRDALEIRDSLLKQKELMSAFLKEAYLQITELTAQAQNKLFPEQ